MTDTIIKTVYFIRSSLKSSKILDKTSLLILIASLLLILVSINIYAIYQSDLVLAVNSNVDNRTFYLSYPLDKDIDAFITTFEKNKRIEFLSFKSDEGFNSFIVTYTLYDYRDRAAMDKQFTAFSDAISYFESNYNFESMFMFKISKYIQLFLVLTILVALALVNTVIIRMLKDLKVERTLLNALGYNIFIQYAVSFLKVMITVTMAFFIAFIIERTLLRHLIATLFIKSAVLVDLEVKWYLTIGKSILLYHLIALTTSIQLAVHFKKGQTIGTIKSF